MKKQYMTPTTEEIKIHTHCIIASSLPGLTLDSNDDNYIDDPEDMD